MAAAASVTTLRRLAKTATLKRKESIDLFSSSLPDKTEWIASYELEMLLLDG